MKRASSRWTTVRTQRRPSASTRRRARALGGRTLVVETTNFTDLTHWSYNSRYNSESTCLTERFAPTGPNTLMWQVTIDDPDVWTKPFTFAMPLTRDNSQPVFEYACHEGNLGLEHILSAARAREAVRTTVTASARRLNRPMRSS